MTKPLDKRRGLDSIRPRPGDSGPGLRAFFDALAEWSWPGPPCLSTINVRPPEPELPLVEVIYAACQLGEVAPGQVWGALLELVDSGAVSVVYRKPSEDWRFDLNKGEGRVHIVTTPEKLNMYKNTVIHDPSMNALETPPCDPVPRWDRTKRELIYEYSMCLTDKKSDPTHFRVLDAFQLQGWPTSLENPLDGDSNPKQTAYEIRKKLKINNHYIEIHYSESSNQFWW